MTFATIVESDSGQMQALNKLSKKIKKKKKQQEDVAHKAEQRKGEVDP